MDEPCETDVWRAARGADVERGSCRVVRDLMQSLCRCCLLNNVNGGSLILLVGLCRRLGCALQCLLSHSFKCLYFL